MAPCPCAAVAAAGRSARYDTPGRGSARTRRRRGSCPASSRRQVHADHPAGPSAPVAADHHGRSRDRAMPGVGHALRASTPRWMHRSRVAAHSELADPSRPPAADHRRTVADSAAQAWFAGLPRRHRCAGVMTDPPCLPRRVDPVAPEAHRAAVDRRHLEPLGRYRPQRPTGHRSTQLASRTLADVRPTPGPTVTTTNDLRGAFTSLAPHLNHHRGHSALGGQTPASRRPQPLVVNTVSRRPAPRPSVVRRADTLLEDHRR